MRWRASGAIWPRLGIEHPIIYRRRTEGQGEHRGVYEGRRPEVELYGEGRWPGAAGSGFFVCHRVEAGELGYRVNALDLDVQGLDLALIEHLALVGEELDFLGGRELGPLGDDGLVVKACFGEESTDVLSQIAVAP